MTTPRIPSRLRENPMASDAVSVATQIWPVASKPLMRRYKASSMEGRVQEAGRLRRARNAVCRASGRHAG
jgi:hypothetical protein